MANQNRLRGTGLPPWLWMGLIGLVSIGLSRAVACVTPFAALAVLAALTLSGRQAAGLVLFTWAANQAVGFGVLHYPVDVTTIAWGIVIGLAAMAGLAAALVCAPIPTVPAAMAAALLSAFSAYEGVLLAATLVLPSGTGAFAPRVMAELLATNAIALLVLLLAHRLAGPHTTGYPVARTGVRLPASM